MSWKSSFKLLVLILLGVTVLVLTKKYKDLVIDDYRAQQEVAVQIATPSIQPVIPPAQPTLEQLIRQRCEELWSTNDSLRYCYASQMVAFEIVTRFMQEHGASVGSGGIYQLVFDRCVQVASNEYGPNFHLVVACLLDRTQPASPDII